MEFTNIHSAKTHLSKLIDRVYEGEEIVICKSGRPLAKLIKYDSQQRTRIPGQWQGHVRMSSDFDILPDSLKAAFRGEDEISS
jgi:prevent-host-death family protein